MVFAFVVAFPVGGGGFVVPRFGRGFGGLNHEFKKRTTDFVLDSSCEPLSSFIAFFQCWIFALFQIGLSKNGFQNWIMAMSVSLFWNKL